jgi:hypothetical protein
MLVGGEALIMGEESIYTHTHTHTHTISYNNLMLLLKLLRKIIISGDIIIF